MNKNQVTTGPQIGPDQGRSHPDLLRQLLVRADPTGHLAGARRGKRVSLNGVLNDLIAQGMTVKRFGHGYRIEGNGYRIEPLAMDSAARPIWSKIADAMLGMIPDQIVADILGCKYEHVWRRRRKLRIGPYRPTTAWTPERDQVVLKTSTREATRLLGISAKAVGTRRCRLRSLFRDDFHDTHQQLTEPAGPPLTLGELASNWVYERFHHHPLKGQLAPNSFYNLRASIKPFIDFVGADKTPAAITESVLDAFPTAPALGRFGIHTQKQAIRYACQFIMWCHSNDFIRRLPRNLFLMRQGAMMSRRTPAPKAPRISVRTNTIVESLPLANTTVGLLRQALRSADPSITQAVCLVNGKSQPDNYSIRPDEFVEFR